jgi:hypothetical protein
MESSKMLVIGGTFLIIIVVAGAFLFTATPLGFVGKFYEGGGSGPRADMSQYSNLPFDEASGLDIKDAEPIKWVKNADGVISGPGNMIFVSSKEFSGDLRGVRTADQRCNEMAQTASLDGDFKAWLSERQLDAITRFRAGDRPYYNMQGQPVAANLDDLAYGNLVNPIMFDENGDKVPPAAMVLTGTQDMGFTKEKTKGALPQCYDWTYSASTLSGSYGLASSTDDRWTDAGVTSCNRDFRIYCIQDG